MTMAFARDHPLVTQAPEHSAVRDTIAAVFRQHAYDRTVLQSLWERLWRVVFDWLGRFFHAVNSSPIGRPLVITMLVIVVTLVLARAAVALVTGDLVIGRATPRFALGGWRTDPWVDAQRFAAQGRYTDAAHALYAALLEGVAQREQLRLHPSKTVGDYVRELRRRSSALVPKFRDFARLYEVVVYGFGFCDRDRYERLYALASSMLAPRP
jgi:hypothetical protein